MLRLTDEEKRVVGDNHSIIEEVLREFELDEQEFYDSACDGLMKAVKAFSTNNLLEATISMFETPLFREYAKKSVIKECLFRCKELDYITAHEVISLDAIEALSGYDNGEAKKRSVSIEELRDECYGIEDLAGIDDLEALRLGQKSDGIEKSDMYSNSSDNGQERSGELIRLVGSLSDYELALINLKMIGNVSVELGNKISESDINLCINKNKNKLRYN